MRRFEDRIIVSLLGAVALISALNLASNVRLFMAQREAEAERVVAAQQFRELKEELAKRISDSTETHAKFLTEIETLKLQVREDRAALQELKDIAAVADAERAKTLPRR